MCSLSSEKDYELFLKLLQQVEDNLDLEEAEERMINSEQEQVGFDEFFAELEVECSQSFG